MMDLRVSVVLLLVFLTGGYSLKCYTCNSSKMGHCNAVEQTCPKGFTKCASITSESSAGNSKVLAIEKGCAKECTEKEEGGKKTQCCDSDLCNAAGYSLKCYMCDSSKMGHCNAVEQTCPSGFTKCASITSESSTGNSKVLGIEKGCAKECTEKEEGGKKTQCCGTNLCNAADGVYQGSLLLFSPLLFYFLFQ